MAASIMEDSIIIIMVYNVMTVSCIYFQFISIIDAFKQNQNAVLNEFYFQFHAIDAWGYDQCERV